MSTPAMIAIAIGMLALTTAAAVFFILRLPRDYFANPHRQLLPSRRRPVLRIFALIGKNLLGWILIVCGIGLAMPGMPGEGILILLIGIVLIDFPGKSRLERRLIRIDWIRKPMNRLRAKFRRAPLQKEL